MVRLLVIRLLSELVTIIFINLVLISVIIIRLLLAHVLVLIILSIVIIIIVIGFWSPYWYTLMIMDVNVCSSVLFLELVLL